MQNKLVGLGSNSFIETLISNNRQLNFYELIKGGDNIDILFDQTFDSGSSPRSSYLGGASGRYWGDTGMQLTEEEMEQWYAQQSL